MSKNTVNELEFLQNKKVTTIALILLLVISALLVAFPLVFAHDPPWTVDTYAFINVAPNPVGVAQQAAISGWIDKIPPGAEGGWGTRWYNMKVTVTRPDGTIEELGPYTSDAVGGIWDWYTPNEVGTYKFVFSFPGQVAKEENPYPYGGIIPLGEDYYNDTYKASTSEPFYLTVQEEPIETAYLANPLPTEYWTRPINSMNREWYSLGGNWLGLAGPTFCDTGFYNVANGNFNPYTTAPNSAHVLWTKPIAFGGQIGGEFGADETSLYATGTAYEGKFGAVILYGILYYTEYPGAKNNPGGLTAVDLRTGETLWTKDVAASLRCGMIYKFNTGDQYGAHAYLFTAPSAINGWVLPMLPNKWSMYEAMTGKWILDIDNASAGTLVRGPNGEILSYTAAGGMLTLWNASKCIKEGSQKNNIYLIYSAEEIWRPPQGATIDWSPGNEWSVPIATNISGAPISPALTIATVSDDVVLLRSTLDLWSGGPPGGSSTGWEIEAGYSAVDGKLLWGPINRTLTPFTTVAQGPAAEGVYTEYTLQTMTWEGYDIKTGEKLWGPTAPYNSSWGYYDFSAPSVSGYGNLYTWGIGGEVYCYDIKTGDLKWSWYAGSAGVDSPYGTWPLGVFGYGVLADGKLYLTAGHDYTPPVFKGAKQYCLNATTGEEIWSSLAFSITSSPAIADGILIKFNGYDNQIYAFGMGPTKTTVTAPDIGVTIGTSVMIRGTVTDVSAGSQQNAVAMNFPNGLPAVSDESMSQFMEAVYQQQPMPQNVTGVEVVLKILDPHGDWYQATVTSDSNGVFSHMWTPDIVGEYHVTAMFEGSKSYYVSQATTTFGVSEAPEDVPSAEEIADTTVGRLPAYPTIPEIPAYLTIDLVILIIAAVGVVIGLIAYMALRKRQ